MIVVKLDDLRRLVRNPQTEIQRLMLEAVITIEVHARDVLFKLIESGVTSANDFDWISQLRYYWMDHELKVCAVNAVFQYGLVYDSRQIILEHSNVGIQIVSNLMHYIFIIIKAYSF